MFASSCRLAHAPPRDLQDPVVVRRRLTAPVLVAVAFLLPLEQAVGASFIPAPEGMPAFARDGGSRARGRGRHNIHGRDERATAQAREG